MKIKTKKIILGWLMVIPPALPPCTYNTNAGSRWLYEEPGRWEKMVESAMFFKRLWDSDIPCIAIENPIPHGHALRLIGTRYTQIIQPWMFGHPESKATCLWLKGLKPLKETNNVYHLMKDLPEKERARIHYAAPGPDRWKIRSETYQGIADAMAEQWSQPQEVQLQLFQ